MKKIGLAVSIILVFAMLLGTFSVAAAAEITTTAPALVPTTSVAGDDEEKSDDYWDGYYDGYDEGYSDAENEDYDSGYNDGYYDGKYDGYHQGYYEGYYDGVNAFREPTIFEKIEYFFAEFRYRIEDFFYRIQDFFERLFKIGDYAPSTPLDPEADFIPDGSQATLEGDADVEALCIEFNTLIDDFMEIKENVTITKNVDVGISASDVPAAVANIANEIFEHYAGTTSVTNDYAPGDYAGTVQSTGLYPAGLVSAFKTVNADGTTDYEFEVVAEAAYYNGDYTTGVKRVDGVIIEADLQHDDIADTIYIEAADLGPVTIKSAEIVYPGATVTAKTDAQGRLIAYDIKMPVKGNGTAKVSLIDVRVSLEGYRNEGFVMTYAD